MLYERGWGASMNDGEIWELRIRGDCMIAACRGHKAVSGFGTARGEPVGRGTRTDTESGKTQDFEQGLAPIHHRGGHGIMGIGLFVRQGLDLLKRNAFRVVGAEAVFGIGGDRNVFGSEPGL